MSLEKEYLDSYLSDEELNALICEIESSDLVMAPPGIKANVLNKVENKKKEYVMYCFRVVLSAAAAIVMLFLLHGSVGNISFEKEIPTKKEVLETEKYVSKEEALDDRSFLQKIFDNINVSAMIMKENGGE